MMNVSHVVLTSYHPAKAPSANRFLCVLDNVS